MNGIYKNDKKIWKFDADLKWIWNEFEVNLKSIWSEGNLGTYGLLPVIFFFIGITKSVAFVEIPEKHN